MKRIKLITLLKAFNVIFAFALGWSFNQVFIKHNYTPVFILVFSVCLIYTIWYIITIFKD